MPVPPSSSAQGTPSRPSSPIFRIFSQGKVEVAVQLPGDRGDVLPGEVAHHVADLVVLFGEVQREIHREPGEIGRGKAVVQPQGTAHNITAAHR